MHKKKKDNPHISAQQFVNVEDIVDDLLYSLDGYLFGYLQVKEGDNSLLSDAEKKSHIDGVTSALEIEKEPWQILSIPRTIDTLGMIENLAARRRQTDNDVKLKLLNGEIAALQDMTAEGTKEPVIILKCWAKAERGADKALNKRLRDLQSRLEDQRITVQRLDSRGITYICKLFGDLSTYQEAEEEFESDVPVLKKERRLFTNKDEKEIGNPALRNLLAPIGGLQFDLSRVIMGDVVGRAFAVVRYPSEIDINWMVELLNTSDCITSISYVPGQATELGDALSRAVKRSAVDAGAESDARRRKRFTKQAEDADQLIEEMDYKNAAIGHMTMLVMPFTSQADRLEDVCRYCVNRFMRYRIKLKALGNMQKVAFKHLSPYYIGQPEIESMVQHIMPLRTLIGGAPMVVNIFRDDNGAYFARTADGGIMALDLFYRSGTRTNGNMVFTGASGRGKSTSLKSILSTLFMLDVKVVINDAEGEFKDMCKKVHGSWIDMGGGTAKINPFQIRPVPLDDDDEIDPLYKPTDNALALHMRTLEVFFRLYLPSLTDLQRAQLKETIIALYKEHGIVWETPVEGIGAEQYPIMSDLYCALSEKSKSDPAYKELAALFYDAANGADSFLWNGYTNIDINNDFICFDTKSLTDCSAEVKQAQYYNLMVQGFYVMSLDATQPVMMVCDEAHTVLNPEVPQAAMYMRNIAKRARKREGILAVALQSLADMLDGPIKMYGQAILDNSAYKIMFGTDGKNLKETTAVFDLTEPEQQYLLSAERGKALFLCGSQHMQINFDIPQYKLDLMGRGGGR